MKRFALIGLTAAIFALSTTKAEARVGWTEDLDFVAETTIPGLSLCHLVKHRTVLFMNVTTESLSYAMAENKCEDDSYYLVGRAELIMAKREGVIPANIPDDPSITRAQAGRNYLIYGVGALAVLAFIVAKLGSLFGRRRNKKTGNDTVVRMLAAMCHVAKADGQIAQGEVATIIQTIHRITGQTLSVDQVTHMIQSSEVSMDLGDLRALGNGLNARDRAKVLEAAMSVAVADGEIAAQEFNYITDLARGLEIKGDEFRIMLRQIAGNMAPQTA